MLSGQRKLIGSTETERRRKYAREYYYSHKAQSQRTTTRCKIKKIYGLSLEEYERKLEEQGGKCQICCQRNGGKKLSIDHDHRTGQFRGLLCHKCNRGIGLFNDDVKRLEAVIQYLSREKTNVVTDQRTNSGSN